MPRPVIDITRNGRRRSQPGQPPRRLWLQLLSLGLLAAGLAGGVALAAHPSGQPSATHGPLTRPESGPSDAARDGRVSRGQPRTSPSVAASPTAPAAIPRATATKPATKPVPKPSTPPPSGPAPAGCASYTGNRLIGCRLLPSYGFSTSQMAALDKLWTHESGWRHTAKNPSSGAYGIPQALPATKMATAGSDWRTNPATQIRWGLSYIKGRYGSPANAWAAWQAKGWY